MNLAKVLNVGVLIDILPAILIGLNGSSSLILVIASLALFANRLFLELNIFKWLIPLSTVIFTIGGVIGIFMISITNPLELIGGIIISSRSLQIIDEIGQKLFI